ncbi:hypothetical protein [Natrinema soli]|uniref:DUF8160 domain-containing protein n=1 Tax=Natrinema soli TaxID=1930624 RepID=A0ABD5SZK8_9EURY|nr:hypothetical protein [Natrinema soli]
MSDDRVDRLRDKRNKSKERARAQQSKSSETSRPAHTGETGEPEQIGEPDDTDESDETDSERVKDEQVGTYFYLPEGQRDDLRYRYKMLSAEYEREFGEELEKNQHFYPLLVEYGLDGLDSADAQDVRDMLGRLDY